MQYAYPRLISVDNVDLTLALCYVAVFCEPCSLYSKVQLSNHISRIYGGLLITRMPNTSTWSRNKVNNSQIYAWLIYRRLGAKGSYLTLVRVADRIL